MNWSLAMADVPPALRHRRLFESMDVEVARERISAVLQPHDLVPRRQDGPRHCHLDHLRFNRAGIGSIRFGRTRVEVPIFGPYYLFIACLTGHATVRIGSSDYEIGAQRAVLLGPDDAMTAEFSENCTQLFVRLDAAAITDHCGRRHVSFRHSVDLQSPLLGPWLRQVAVLASDAQTARLAAEVNAIGVEYESLLVQLLLAGQPHDAEIEPAPAVLPRSVKRAEAFMRDRYSDPLTLSDIARSAGVPARTLQDNFRRFHSMAPVRYLRGIRLDAARDALRRGDVATATEAAMNVGLFHLGRFSRDYSDRFGEQPSETIRRAGRPNMN